MKKNSEKNVANNYDENLTKNGIGNDEVDEQNNNHKILTPI